MVEILNMALKKDVFEGLQNGTTNQIIIEKTNWWKKRLMDIDTGRFKPFEVVVASCGSADKVEYKIENMELVENNFIITVNVGYEEEQPVQSNEEDMGNSDEPESFNEETPTDDQGNEDTESLEEEVNHDNPDELIPTGVNPVTVNEDGSVTMETKEPYVSPEVITKKIQQEFQDNVQKFDEPQAVKVKTIITKLFNNMCESKDVYLVSMPNVTIRNNGQILGCKKRLIADRDSDVKFNFKKMVFIRHNINMGDTAFLMEVTQYMSTLLKNNYVFINKSACGFGENEFGELTFTITAVARRKYLFKRL